jgi:isoquinoline 1-oxidoreductase beta subunit
MRQQQKMNRRDFLKISGGAGIGLIVGLYLTGCKASVETMPEPAQPPVSTVIPTSTPTLEPTALLEPSVYLKIDNYGHVTITVHRSEMGQGVRTSLPMVIAEELAVDFSTIRVEQAPADETYGNQTTGGSRSISSSFDAFRRAGAVAREMLIAAAAQIWGVDKDACYADQGMVVHQTSGRQLPYADLVEIAATLPVPSQVSLKSPEDFRVIGTPRGHIDTPQILTGSAVYGIDVKIPNMVYATIARCPVFGGEVSSFEATQAKAVPGVKDVVQISNGVAVIAEHTWAAIQGREALEVTWNEGRNADFSSANLRENFTKGLPINTSSNNGETLEAVYDVPFFAHATMEPMNCTADVRADRCEVWAPTQVPQEARDVAQRTSGLPAEAVTVHVTLLGGGFGRRLETDYVAEAVEISQAIDAPVQVVWTREDDMQHDFYHPLSVHRTRIKLEGTGRPLTDQFYAWDLQVPTGAWRSVNSMPDAFARECFLHELAVAKGKDPYQFRLETLRDRERAVLELAATQAGWGTPLPEGWGRGIGFHSTWDVTPTAIVAEVSVAQDGTARVERVVCAVDCGIVVNPNAVEAQMEGGIVFGLTAVLKQAITIENGRVEQSNFHDYPLLRLDEMPVVEVHLVPSDRPPSGVGEMSTPPVVPAVVNAIFDATGKRIRRLPIRPEDLA